MPASFTGFGKNNKNLRVLNIHTDINIVINKKTAINSCPETELSRAICFKGHSGEVAWRKRNKPSPTAIDPEEDASRRASGRPEPRKERYKPSKLAVSTMSNIMMSSSDLIAPASVDHKKRVWPGHGGMYIHATTMPNASSKPTNDVVVAYRR